MIYRNTDTLREAIFKTLAEVKDSTSVHTMMLLADNLAAFIEAHPEKLEKEEPTSLDP